jgi:thermitase
MRKGFAIGLLVAVLFLGVITATHPFRQTGQPRINSTSDRISSYNTHNHIRELSTRKRPNGSMNIQNVDSIGDHNELKTYLNNNPDIKVISHNKQDKSHYYEKEVVVNFKISPDQASLNKIMQNIDGLSNEKLDSMYIFKSKSQSTERLVSYFKDNPNVEYVEPHYIYIPNEVNDTYYQSYQWNLPAVGTEDGWNITRGSKNIKIAVVDTGVDLDHPDLKGRLIDGFNALDHNSPPDDDNGHGTHVAGIIASDTNNGKGVAGITWYNPIIPVKVMNAKGHGGSFDVAQGIRWAVDHGANVINLSLGNYQNSSVMKDAVNYALKKDVVVVSAAGNDNTNQTSYPAAYNGVLGVAAVDSTGNRANFSNYGDYVDVAAPGVDIPSTYSNGRYAALSGTSMAAPHVTALAGLIRSINPKLKNKDVLDIITQTTQKVGQTPNPYIGNGIIDNINALQTTYSLKYPNRKH